MDDSQRCGRRGLDPLGWNGSLVSSGAFMSRLTGSRDERRRTARMTSPNQPAKPM